ncbi:hypothetical protein DVA86_27075 [Streptomyces armeniacus]|uniref:Guanylate cyclase domain-containing protein n=1 Tax=Streptomyces armeniacus TaxID=83291 RepID=A0A345XVT5_9ACTN|nr:hypothetical protein [Streptomyces armeniacus]AXK35751.1 hypothetical protein DVA86_27075 [Streptomyces armeniacus]
MLPSWEHLWPYRAVLAVDARNFSALNSKDMQQVNSDIPPLLAEALSASNVSAHWERRMFGQHTGDGYVAGMDPEVLPALVGCFPNALRDALVRRRAKIPTGAPLQLRVSIHVGPLPPSGLGVPMVHTHRLLDDDSLRTVLNRANPDITNTAVIVSERVYEDVFESGCVNGDSLPDQFARHLVKVKKFQQPAWVHIPGFDWGLADPDIFERPDSTDPEGQSQNISASVSSPQPMSAAPGSVAFNQHGAGGVQAYNYGAGGWQR